MGGLDPTLCVIIITLVVEVVCPAFDKAWMSTS